MSATSSRKSSAENPRLRICCWYAVSASLRKCCGKFAGKFARSLRAVLIARYFSTASFFPNFAVHSGSSFKSPNRLGVLSASYRSNSSTLALLSCSTFGPSACQSSTRPQCKQWHVPQIHKRPNRRSASQHVPDVFYSPSTRVSGYRTAGLVSGGCPPISPSKAHHSKTHRDKWYLERILPTSPWGTAPAMRTVHASARHAAASCTSPVVLASNSGYNPPNFPDLRPQSTTTS